MSHKIDAKHLEAAALHSHTSMQNILQVAYCRQLCIVTPSFRDIVVTTMLHDPNR